jgi:hypothetical protein
VSKKCIFNTKRHIRLPAMLRLATAALLLLAAGPSGAAPNPKPPAGCPLMITDCGCTIVKPGAYVAVNTLMATASNQTCIKFAASASGATLNLMGFDVTGKDGTGTGIWIQHGAHDVIVEGGLESSRASSESPAAAPNPSGQSQVTNWNIGIQDDGDRAIIALFSFIGGTNLFPPGPGNTTGGILLNHVERSFVGDLNADVNGKYGILLDHTSRINIGNISVDRNKDVGLELDSAERTTFGPGGADDNVNQGILLLGSSRNEIHDSNGNTSNGTAIMLDGGSNDNRISNAGGPKNDVAGIVITAGSGGNIITVTHNEDNTSPYDMIDLNPNCGSNTWYNNVGRGNHGCIQ